MTLNWADTNANEFGYAIYRSVDGVNYDFIRQTAANATSSVKRAWRRTRRGPGRLSR
jgi:hypothetical protein